MRKITIILMLAMLFCFNGPITFATNWEHIYRDQVFPVYTDKNAANNHYILSGYMGDYNDLKINDAYRDSPHCGSTCIRIEYTAEQSLGRGWAGVYWQYPANNWRWGTNRKGYNLTGYTKLTFWARGENGGEKLSEVGVGCIRSHFKDSDNAIIGPLELTKDWKEYTIDLNDLDLSDISGGFHWVCYGEEISGKGIIFYLDDIVYEK
ncbi:MAG: hypothetical protein PHV60_04360 [bacterium]|nr:hypothetical protein [bacterium]